MPSAPDIITDISERVETFVQARHTEMLDDGGRTDPIAEVLMTHARNAVAGGKRLRARFALWGWRAAHGSGGTPSEAVLDLGASLELFQAAALVHDDIVDNSDTRRGRPASWRALEREHRERGWTGSAVEFGRSCAILLGDLLIGWSDDLMEESLAALDDATAARSTRAVYARMRRDVTLGQFLDVAEEAAWRTTPDEDHADRAMRIAVLKSARYSVQQPLVLGGCLGGADAAVRASLAAIGHPLGLAFQLRDDVLGAFGDPTVTGKPAGDDLREGKRTLLIAYAREAMDPGARDRLDARLGAPDLTDDEVARLQDAVRAAGAVDRVEGMIASQAEEASSALAHAGFDPETTTELAALITATTDRAF